MAQIGSPPAGWYTDPSGQHRARYWDGVAWTEQVRDDLGEPGPGPSTGSASSPATTPSVHPMAETVASVAEAVAAVAAKDVQRPTATTDTAFVVDYGSEPSWLAPTGSTTPPVDATAAVAPDLSVAGPSTPVPGVEASTPASDPFAPSGPTVTAPSAFEPGASPLGQTVTGSPVAPTEPIAPVTNGPVAGWYPDPAGRHQARLWDGMQWTARVADAGVEAIDPLPGAPTATATAVDAGAAVVGVSTTATAEASTVPVGPDGRPLTAGQISLASLPEPDEPETPSERPEVRPSVKVRVAGGFMLGGAIALVAGSLTTWMEVRSTDIDGGVSTSTGLDLGDGRIMLALGVVLAGLGLAVIMGWMKRLGGVKVAAMGGLVAGAAAVAVTAVEIADIADRASRLGVPPNAFTDVGNGLWLAFLGALFAVGGGLMAFANRQ